jgi:hypothetical protein
MYLRITQRHNRDGSTVSYYALAESVWNPDAKRREANVVHSFGRADQLDRGELERLVKSINRVLEDGNDDADSSPTSSNRPEIEIERVFELGVALAARSLWEELGIGPAIRRCAEQAKLTAPHETALFAMAANRLEDPVSKLACAERWLPDIAWLPDAAGLAVDQCYRALDFLAVWAEEIEREVFLKAADLFRLDVDLIFYDTTTAYFEIDEPDENEQEWGGRIYAPLRRRGHSQEGRDNQPQAIIALAVTRDGMPVRSWARLAKVPMASAIGMQDEGLPGNTADVTTVARIKDDLRAWRLGRCLFVGDAGMYSADNLAQLSRGLGRYILAVPMRRVRDIEDEVLTRPGRYKQVADNLQVKEVWVGDGERRKRYVLCLNPREAERERTRRAQLLVELNAELALLEQRQEDHPKAACELMASRRYSRYLTEDGQGRPHLDTAKVKAAEKFDGKFVVISNDDTLSAEDIALGYQGGWIIESCFRRMKQTGLQVRPMFHWTPRRIEAHVKLCVLALQMQRAAEIRCQLPWARIAHALGGLKAVRYRCESRTIVQRSKITAEMSPLLKSLKILVPKQVLLVEEAASGAASA